MSTNLKCDCYQLLPTRLDIYTASSYSQSASRIRKLFFWDSNPRPSRSSSSVCFDYFNYHSIKPWSWVRIPGGEIEKQLSHSRKADRGWLGAVMKSGRMGSSWNNCRLADILMLNCDKSTFEIHLGPGTNLERRTRDIKFWSNDNWNNQNQLSYQAGLIA